LADRKQNETEKVRFREMTRGNGEGTNVKPKCLSWYTFEGQQTVNKLIKQSENEVRNWRNIDLAIKWS
jgi:hypothetical protein